MCVALFGSIETSRRLLKSVGEPSVMNILCHRTVQLRVN